VRFERFENHGEAALERGRVDDDEQRIGLAVEIAIEDPFDDLLVESFSPKAVASWKVEHPDRS
jgi:hypothetical protein